MTTVPLDVVIPVHDVQHYLRAAVDSALRQRGADVRVIVVDDGSAAGVGDEVRSWGEGRVSVVRHAANRGIGAARNTGAAHGDRAWLGFLDVDDLWPLDRTRQLVRSATDKTALLVGHQLVFDDGNDPDPAGEFPLDGTRPARLASAMLFPRDVFVRVGRFDEGLRFGDFVDWMVRARAAGIGEREVAHVSLLRRSHAANTTRTMTAARRDYLQVVARARAGARDGAGARPALR